MGVLQYSFDQVKGGVATTAPPFPRSWKIDIV